MRCRRCATAGPLPRPPFRSFLATAADPSPNFGGGVVRQRVDARRRQGGHALGGVEPDDQSLKRSQPALTHPPPTVIPKEAPRCTWPIRQRRVPTEESTLGLLVFRRRAPHLQSPPVRRSKNLADGAHHPVGREVPRGSPRSTRRTVCRTRFFGRRQGIARGEGTARRRPHQDSDPPSAPPPTRRERFSEDAERGASLAEGAPSSSILPLVRAGLRGVGHQLGADGL
jgi:hypothetical protein